MTDERNLRAAYLLVEQIGAELNEIPMPAAQRALLQQKLVHVWRHVERAFELNQDREGDGT